MNRRRIALGLTLALAASLVTITSVASAAAPVFAGLDPQLEPSIPGSTVDSSIAPGEPSPAEKRALTAPPAVSWPAAGVASLAVVDTTAQRAGTLPVAVSLPPAAGGTAT